MAEQVVYCRSCHVQAHLEYNHSKMDFDVVCIKCSERDSVNKITAANNAIRMQGISFLTAEEKQAEMTDEVKYILNRWSVVKVHEE